MYKADKEEKSLSEKEMLEKLQTYPDGNAFLKESYVEMLHNPHAHSAYCEFFHILIEHNREDEALLFHCASGKDRTGFAAALILLSLGFSKEVIIEDYLLSNQYVRDEAVRVSERIRQQGQPETVVKMVYSMLMVQQSHIEYVFEEMKNMYQDTDTYLKKVLGIGNAEREALAVVYLE